MLNKLEDHGFKKINEIKKNLLNQNNSKTTIESLKPQISSEMNKSIMEEFKNDAETIKTQILNDFTAEIRNELKQEIEWMFSNGIKKESPEIQQKILNSITNELPKFKNHVLAEIKKDIDIIKDNLKKQIISELSFYKENFKTEVNQEISKIKNITNESISNINTVVFEDYKIKIQNESDYVKDKLKDELPLYKKELSSDLNDIKNKIITELLKRNEKILNANKIEISEHIIKNYEEHNKKILSKINEIIKETETLFYKNSNTLFSDLKDINVNNINLEYENKTKLYIKTYQSTLEKISNEKTEKLLTGIDFEKIFQDNLNDENIQKYIKNKINEEFKLIQKEFNNNKNLIIQNIKSIENSVISNITIEKNKIPEIIEQLNSVIQDKTFKIIYKNISTLIETSYKTCNELIYKDVNHYKNDLTKNYNLFKEDLNNYAPILLNNIQEDLIKNIPVIQNNIIKNISLEVQKIKTQFDNDKINIQEIIREEFNKNITDYKEQINSVVIDAKLNIQKNTPNIIDDINHQAYNAIPEIKNLLNDLIIEFKKDIIKDIPIIKQEILNESTKISNDIKQDLLNHLPSLKTEIKNEIPKIQSTVYNEITNDIKSNIPDYKTIINNQVALALKDIKNEIPDIQNVLRSQTNIAIDNIKKTEPFVYNKIKNQLIELKPELVNNIQNSVKMNLDNIINKMAEFYKINDNEFISFKNKLEHIESQYNKNIENLKQEINSKENNALLSNMKNNVLEHIIYEINVIKKDILENLLKDNETQQTIIIKSKINSKIKEIENKINPAIDNLKINEKNVLKKELEEVKSYFNLYISTWNDQVHNIIAEQKMNYDKPKEYYMKKIEDNYAKRQERLSSVVTPLRSVKITTEPVQYIQSTPKNKFTFFLSGSGNGDRIINHLAAYHNMKTYNNISKIEGIFVNWGILRGSEILLKKCLNENIPFLYVDHAYLNYGHNKPRPSYRICYNSFQARDIIDRPNDRLKQLNITPKDWKKGEHILVCPPTPAVMHFFDCATWLNDTLTLLEKYTDREIIVRNKPNEVMIDLSTGVAIPIKSIRNKVSVNNQVPLSEHLNNCHAVVTYNSNVAIDAVLEGVPVYVNKISAAYTIGHTDLQFIETPIYPDILPWLKHLSYSQFYIDEIQSGKVWNYFKFD